MSGAGFRRLLIGVLAALAITACGRAPSDTHLGDPAESSSTASTQSTVTSTTEVMPTTTVPIPWAKVGDTLSFSTDPVLGPGTPEFNVTLNQVIDPASIDDPSHPLPQGERYVEMKITIANVGTSPLPVEGAGGPGILEFKWYLNPSGPDTGEEMQEGFPFATCQGVVEGFSHDLTPGQSITGCVEFGPIPNSIAVTGFETSLEYGGHVGLSQKAWQIS